MYEVDLHDDGINSDGWDVLFMRCCVQFEQGEL